MSERNDEASAAASTTSRLSGGVAGESDREVKGMSSGQGGFFVHGSASFLGSPRAWCAFLRTHLGRPVRIFAVEFGARCAINHLRSLDDDRLRDLGLERKEIERFVRFGRD